MTLKLKKEFHSSKNAIPIGNIKLNKIIIYDKFP